MGDDQRTSVGSGRYEMDTGLSARQLRKLADDLIAKSEAPWMGQGVTEYIRNDAFRTLARSLLDLAEEDERNAQDMGHGHRRA